MLAVLMFLFITGMQAQTVTPSKKYISIYKKRTNITLPTFRINAEQ